MSLARQIVYWLLVLSGLAWLAARLNRHKVLILVYHGVYAGADDPLLNFDGMHVRASRFSRQLRYVARRYRVVPLDELHDAGAAARERRAVITIDDGYRNIHQVAYPIVKSLSLPATLFVPTDFVLGSRGMWWDRLRVMLATTRQPALACSVGGSDHILPIRTLSERLAAVQALNGGLRDAAPARREEMLAVLAGRLGVSAHDTGDFGAPLSATELRTMHAGGLALGSHGMSHASFLHLSAEDLARELSASKNVLEWLTREHIRWLAYPHGDFSPAVAAAARRAGYRGAVTTVEALAGPGQDAYAVTRIGVHDRMTMAHFIVATSGLHDFVTGVVASALRLWRRLQWRRSAAFPAAGARTR